jgi:hypothetical protein
MTTDNRKAKVTEETREESRKLLELWKSRPRPTQAEFGEMYDIGNQSAVGHFLHGRTPLSAKAAVGFARGLNCRVADFSFRLAKQLGGLGIVLNPILPADAESPLGFTAPGGRRVSDADWELLQDVKLVLMADELATIRKRAAHVREQQRALGEVPAGPVGPKRTWKVE